MTDNTESRMVAAHKTGREFYQLMPFLWERGDLVQSLLSGLAKLYATEQEREAFCAGFLGEMRRMIAKQSQSKVTDS